MWKEVISYYTLSFEAKKNGRKGLDEVGDGDGGGGGEQYNRISALGLDEVEILWRGSRVDDHRGAGFGIGSAAPSFDDNSDRFRWIREERAILWFPSL